MEGLRAGDDTGDMDGEPAREPGGGGLAGRCADCQRASCYSVLAIPHRPPSTGRASVRLLCLQLHPATRDDVVLVNMRPGGMRDPTTRVRRPPFRACVLLTCLLGHRLCGGEANARQRSACRAPLVWSPSPAPSELLSLRTLLLLLGPFLTTWSLTQQTRPLRRPPQQPSSHHSSLCAVGGAVIRRPDSGPAAPRVRGGAAAGGAAPHRHPASRDRAVRQQVGTDALHGSACLMLNA